MECVGEHDQHQGDADELDAVQATEAAEQEKRRTLEEARKKQIVNLEFLAEAASRLLAIAKELRPDYVARCADGHWSKWLVEKQRVDLKFADCYLAECYTKSIVDTDATEQEDLPITLENPRQRISVTYGDEKNAKLAILTSVVANGKETSLSEKSQKVLMPKNLSWLWPGEVAVSSTPKSVEQVKAFEDALNLGLVITLTREALFATNGFLLLRVVKIISVL
jgi:hypothetical protein